MKVYTRHHTGKWSVDPIPPDAANLFERLPDDPQEHFRILVEHYHPVPRYYRIAARRGEYEAFIAEELSETDARSLLLAYLRERENVFRAMYGTGCAIAELIRQNPVLDKISITPLTSKIILRKDKAFVNKLIDRVRCYRMQRKKGLRIALSDSIVLDNGEKPDLQLVRMPLWARVAIGSIGMVVLAFLLSLFFRGCDGN